jgi:hypothetical protein
MDMSKAKTNCTEVCPALGLLVSNQESRGGWTTTERHERVDVGWNSATLRGDDGQRRDHIEMLWVPVIEGGDGPRKVLFAMPADGCTSLSNSQPMA